MSIVLANLAKPVLLGLKLSTLNGGSMRLFKNNLTPTGANVLSDFVEADFTGYPTGTGVPLTGVFGTPYLNGSNQGETDGSLVTFTQTGTGTTCDVYGYYVLDGSGNLLFSERNAAAPIAMNAAGLSYTVLPQFLEDTL